MNWPALAVKLIALRTRVGLTQLQLEKASGVGVKTISTFESCARTHTIKLAQLEAITAACGMTLADFFEWEYDADAELAMVQRMPLPPRPSSNEGMDRRAKKLASQEKAPARDLPSPQSPLGNRKWTPLLPWSS